MIPLPSADVINYKLFANTSLEKPGSAPKFKQVRANGRKIELAACMAGLNETA